MFIFDNINISLICNSNIIVNFFNFNLNDITFFYILWIDIDVLVSILLLFLQIKCLC